MDNLVVFKYLIIIELILLFVSGYFGGRTGLIVTVLVSVILVTWLYLAALGMSAAYSTSGSNRSTHIDFDLIKMIMILILTFSYIAVGVYLLVGVLKQQKQGSIFLYLWLASIMVTIVSISVVVYINDPVRQLEVDNKRQVKRRQWEKEIYDKLKVKLQNQFDRSMTNIKEVDTYIKLSESVSKQLKEYNSLPDYFAFYTTKLLINYITSGELEIAKYIFESYIDRIIPHSGLSEKSSDVACNAIVLSILIDDDKIYERVETHILGKNFDIEEISNEALLFNLAYHYSLIRDKKQLLSATALAIKYGKPRDQFLADNDFNYFLYDRDFLFILNSGVHIE